MPSTESEKVEFTPRTSQEEEIAAAQVPDASDVYKALAEREDEEKAREEWLASPEAIEQREDSLLAFGGLSAGESEQLLRAIFEPQLEALNGDPSRFLSDAQLVKPVDDSAAIVKDEGDGSLMDSTLPVRTEDENGELSKVDLTLEEGPEGFKTDNALTELTLPVFADGAIEVGDEGFAIAQAGAAESPARRFGDKNLFYPEVLPDTDLLVAANSFGAELFDLLRSKDSPEEFRFAIEVPAEAELRSDGGGGAEVLREGETLTHIPPPAALDAQQTEVPVTLEIDGDSIVLRLAHRSGDYAYPILLDPIIENGNNWYDGSNLALLTNGAWKWTSNNGNIAHDVCCWGGTKPGLLTTVQDAFYGPEQYGQWSYSTANGAVLIVHAWMNPFLRVDNGCGSAEPHDYTGLWNPGDQWAPFLRDEAKKKQGAVTLEGWGQAMVIGAGSGAPGVWLACDRNLYSGGVALWLDDTWGPGITSAGVPSGSWFGDKAPTSISVSSWDEGLGVQFVKLLNEGKGVVAEERPNNCTGLYGSTCPTTRDSPFNGITGDSFGEGVRNSSVTVSDPTGKVAEKFFTTKVDNSKPEVALSGQLAEATGEEVSFKEDEEPVEEGEDKLRLPVYNLEIKAKDGVWGTSDGKLKRSGVKSIEVRLDGAQKKVWEPLSSCPQTSCEMNVTYPLDLTEIDTAGSHKLKVIAKDFVGEEKEREIEFEYFPATGMKDEYVMHYFPLPNGQGNEAEEENPVRPELAVNVMNGNLVYRERDIDVDGTAGVDLEVERFYNSQLPDSENTEWGDGWTLAQTPDLEPVDTGGSPAPDEAELIDRSGAVEEEIELPTEAGAEKFDPVLQATLEKKSTGGFELTDETGESATSVVFDVTGQTEARLTENSAKVDYGYEGGELAEIEVTDPATFAADSSDLEIPKPELISAPKYNASFGAYGSADGQFKSPSDVAIDLQGNLLVVDKVNNRIQKFDSSGKFISKFGVLGTGNGQFNRPASVAVDRDGNILVADSNNHRIEKFNPAGEFISKFGAFGTGNGQFNRPEEVIVDFKGNIWVADSYNGRVQKFDENGQFLKVVDSEQLFEPLGMDVDPGGNIWVSDRQKHRILVYDSEGEFKSKVGSFGTGNGQFNRPDAIEIDDKGNVWVADLLNNRVQRFDLAGQYQGQFGTPGTGPGQFALDLPTGIATDREGHLWVTDFLNERIQRWLTANYAPAGATQLDLTDGDAKVEVETPGGLVSSVAGNAAGEHDYAHEGDLLVSHDGPDGETDYDYDEGRLSKITLPNGTWAEIDYEADYGRVEEVRISIEGGAVKATEFEYEDEPRRTKVIPQGAPHLVYDIGDDGSVLKWWNVKKPPELDIHGALYDNREIDGFFWEGARVLEVDAESVEGLASIQIIANGDTLVDEHLCPKPKVIECTGNEESEWVTESDLHAPGHLQLEVIATDRNEESTSERFWVDVPKPAPLAPGTPVQPRFRDIARFREEYGLEVVFPVANETELNERILDLIKVWNEPNTPAGQVARATMDRWGVPLRPADVAELEFRTAYWKQMGKAIPDWSATNAAGSFAGVYIDHPAGGVVRAGFTGDQSGTVNALKQTASLMAPDRVQPFGAVPQYSLAALKVFEGQVRPKQASYPSGLINRIGIDVEANRLSIGASDVSQANSLLQADFGAGFPGSVYYSPSSPTPRNDWERITGPILGGDEIILPWAGPCSAGFGAFQQWTKPNGGLAYRTFVLTAGHCVLNYQEPVSRRNNPNPTPQQKQEIGVTKRTGYDENPSTIDTDAAAILLKSGYLMPRQINASPAPPIDVKGVELPGKGTRVCHMGRTSKKVLCGEVISGFPEPVEYGEEQDFLQICFEALSEGGDSGGVAWIEGTNTAVGLLVAGTDPPIEESCFTPLLPFPGEPDVPGALADPGMAPLSLATQP